nr:MAG: hypothetical protein CR984_02570 [Pseudomonadota bacterium]PIE67761.1 MAG: hypothetical protein CSA23_02330 [Deltaproteobacteria bacterium]
MRQFTPTLTFRCFPLKKPVKLFLAFFIKRVSSYSRTYKGVDGFAPIFAYLGTEGYLVNLEFREGKQHCQKNTPQFINATLDYARQIRVYHRLKLLPATKWQSFQRAHKVQALAWCSVVPIIRKRRGFFSMGCEAINRPEPNSTICATDSGPIVDCFWFFVILCG